MCSAVKNLLDNLLNMCQVTVGVACTALIVLHGPCLQFSILGLLVIVCMEGVGETVCYLQHLGACPSGASSDLEQATKLARNMVTKYGMSEKVGNISIDYEDDGRSLSSETRSAVEEEVCC